MRLPPETFDLPIAELRFGYRSATYFPRAQKILRAELPDKSVMMQYFQKDSSVLCGIDEALSIFRVAAGHYTDLPAAERLFGSYMEHKFRARRVRIESPMQAGSHEAIALRIEGQMNELWEPAWDKLKVYAGHDGDEIEPWQPVLHIEGPLSEFIHLESVPLGLLARRTKVATNVRNVCRAANGKPVLFFADRFDDYHNQGGDGYAAHVGGAMGVASDAMAAWWGEKGLGTMPHALIAAYKGDVVAATAAFEKHVPNVDLIALVDFTNDCVGESLRCAKHFGDRLWGVRLDTSENMVDKSVMRDGDMGDYKPTGVNATLVRLVRRELDRGGFEHVKIVVSGGFNVEKITAFERQQIPVDSYAVGSSLLQGSRDYTADVVWPAAKVGRRLRPTPHLELVE